MTGLSLEPDVLVEIVYVSSIKELARRWYPKIYFAAPAKTGNHRALGNIQGSIVELKYYRSSTFIDAQIRGRIPLRKR
jgi:oligoribonuclease